MGLLTSLWLRDALTGGYGSRCLCGASPPADLRSVRLVRSIRDGDGAVAGGSAAAVAGMERCAPAKG